MDFSIDNFATIVEDGIRSIEYPAVAPGLYSPIRYTLESGGKRIRPILTLAAYAAISGNDPHKALNQALAIELFHNFTLLHDDVMDNADLRRGRPTVHRKWNSNVAILSGDAMLTMAQQHLAVNAGEHLEQLSLHFNQTAMQIYQGQQLDMEFETRSDVTVDEYTTMIGLKTSVLLGCACRLGAIMADADTETADALYDYGFALGMAFQLQDDWLDTFGDPAVFGKEIGGDIINRKKTWLLITAMEAEPENLAAILAEDIEPAQLIRRVKELYERHNIGDRCKALAASYSEKAANIVAQLGIDDRARKFLSKLAADATTRNH